MTFWERSAEFRWGTYLTARERSVLRSAIAGVPPGAALEVGCDGGRWCILLADCGWSVAGCDVNPTAVALCRERIPNGEFTLVQPTSSRLPVSDRSMDLLLVIEVPEVTQSTWFPEEAARVLKVGGMCVFCVHNGRSLRGAVYTVLSEFGERRKYRNFYADTVSRFRTRMESSGFVFAQLEGFAWFPFQRNSNSRLISIAETTERFLGLRKLPGVSPFVAGVTVLVPAGRIE